jgi:hypothetical protein
MTSLPDSFRQVGIMAGKVLKGTKPADLPVERPTKFEMVVNLKTARAIGVTLATSILLRADEVIVVAACRLRPAANVNHRSCYRRASVLPLLKLDAAFPLAG